MKVAARDVEVRNGFARHGRLSVRRLVSDQTAEPAQSLAEVAANPRGRAQIVRDEPRVIAVAALFSRLQSGAELALGLSPLPKLDEAQPPCVAALRTHDRALARQRGGAVEVRESRLILAATPRERGERVQRFGLALFVALLVQERHGAVKERLRRVVLVLQARDFSAVRQCARVRFERSDGQGVCEGGERGQSARANPSVAVRGDGARRAFVVFSREQVMHGLLPLLAFEEVSGDARVLGGEAAPPRLDAQAAL
jgi:hypothetical protein